MVRRREKFIYAQIASMLGSLLFLSVFNALTLSLWYLWSTVSFFVLGYRFRMHHLPPKPRRRLYILGAVSSAVAIIIVGNIAIQLLLFYGPSPVTGISAV